MNATVVNERRYSEERKAQAEFAKRNKARQARLDEIYKRGKERVLMLLTYYYANFRDARELEKRMTPRDIQRLNGERTDVRLSRSQFFEKRISEEVAIVMLNLEDTIYDVMMVEYLLELRKLREDERMILSAEERAEFQELVNAKHHGATYQERIGGKKGHYDRLHDALILYTMNVLTGQRVKGITTQRIMDDFDKSERSAMQLVRTEAQRIKNQTSIREYKRQGYTHYVYVTEVGACSFCAPLGNKIIPIEEAVEGYNFPLKHPNCYCSTYGVIETRGMFALKSNVDAHIKEYGSVNEAYRAIKREK